MSYSIEIFRFFKLAAVHHLGCLWGILGAHTEGTWWSLSLCTICYDRCSSFDNMNVSIFGALGWKMPIHAPKGYLTSKWGAVSIKAKKGTALHESASFEPSSVKIW